MQKLIEDLFPNEGSIHDKLLWYDNLTRRYSEFDWSMEYPPRLCNQVFQDLQTILSTSQYTSVEWLNYMKVLDRIQCSSEPFLQTCIQSMFKNNQPFTLVRPQDVREFLRMYPDRDNIPLLRFFILNTLTGSDDYLYRRLVLYTIKNEFPIRCYLQSLPKKPSLLSVVECNVNYEDPIFELDLLYLNRINE
jgi:hypothetical protein